MTALATYIIAGAVGSFFIFALLGFGALVFTAAMDSKIGKERALFVYALGLAALTFFVLQDQAPEKQRIRTGKVSGLAEAPDQVTGDPFAHPAYDLDLDRNVFQKYSDTRKLPPVELEAPPWLPLAFPLPPTIPGPAPGHRRVLRGELPTLTAGDGTSVAEIPEAVFQEYTPVPEDVYDWITDANGKRVYIYIVALKEPGGAWILEGKPGYESLKWRLANQGEGWDEITVRSAYIGSKEKASKVLSKEDVLKRRLQNIGERTPNDGDVFSVRLSVANLYHRALRTYGINDLTKAGENALRQAARKMAEVGRTGKENKGGWVRAVKLLEQALEYAKANNVADTQRAEILLELLEAQRALRDDKGVLGTLAEYARTAPNNHRPWAWLGDAMLEIGIASLGGDYYRDALDKNRTDATSIIGAGDALAWQGDHAGALKTWRRAQSTPSARVRIAEGYLRVGQLEAAKREVEKYIATDPGNPEATLIRGAVYYALGELETARGAFQAVATMADARGTRAQACYNLGLTCLRMGQHDAAQGAFSACIKALELGSSLGPLPDETIAPSLGQALISLATGDVDGARTHIDTARAEAPSNAYVEFLAGVLAERGGNTASAVRGLEASKRIAPSYGELDGWLAITYLRLGEQQAATSGSGADNDYFERAEAFAQRAAKREGQAERTAFQMQLRLALIQLRAQHVAKKQRYTNALASAKKVVNQAENRDQPAAHAILGFCHYGLGGTDNIKQCIRDFQKVLDDVPEDSGDPEDPAYKPHPWKGWREYADSTLAAVKRWDSLEEKSVSFDDTNLSSDWKADNPNKVLVKVVDRMLRFSGESKKDGSFRDPIVQLTNQTLFGRDTLEEVSFEIKCPPKRAGVTANNVTFGVQLLSGRGKGGKLPGIGVFYDKGKMSYRVGGGQKEAFQDGLPRRAGDDITEREWPTDEWLTVRLVRHDRDKGDIGIYLTGDDGNEIEVFRDFVAGFKRSRGKALLWFGGWSNEAERFDVHVRNIRVVRRTK